MALQRGKNAREWGGKKLTSFRRVQEPGKVDDLPTLTSTNPTPHSASHAVVTAAPPVSMPLQ